jgi:hypothetical protein
MFLKPEVSFPCQAEMTTSPLPQIIANHEELRTQAWTNLCEGQGCIRNKTQVNFPPGVLANWPLSVAHHSAEVNFALPIDF